MSLRLLHICSYYSDRLYALLFDSLCNRGIEQEVFVFAPYGSGARCSGPFVRYTECYTQADRLFYRRKQEKVMAAFLAQYNVADFDVLHAHSLFTNGFVAMQAKRLYGKPYIVAVRNTDLNEFFSLRPWLRGLGVEIMKQAEQIIFLSQAYRSALFSRFVPKSMVSELRGKSKVIPNGIDRLFLDATPTAPRAEDGSVRLIQVGDVNKNKNQTTVLKACALLRERGYDVRYKVIGSHDDKGVVEKLRKSSFVELHEAMPQQKLIQEYRSSDVFVMPSHHETFGLVYAEAMSQGLPVVFTAGQGFDGYFDDGEVGASADSRSENAIAEAVEYCALHRQSMFRRCIEGSRMFDWSELAGEYVRLYEEIGERD